MTQRQGLRTPRQHHWATVTADWTSRSIKASSLRFRELVDCVVFTSKILDRISKSYTEILPKETVGSLGFGRSRWGTDRTRDGESNVMHFSSTKETAAFCSQSESWRTEPTYERPKLCLLRAELWAFGPLRL